MEQQLATEILARFTEITDIQAKWRTIRKTDYGRYERVDGLVQFNMGKAKFEIPAEVKPAVHNATIPHLLNLLKINPEIIVLAKTILPSVKRDLQALKINYIDGAGNAYIRNDRVAILLDGFKAITTNTGIKTQPFSKTGLKVIFQILQTDAYINATIREIANAAGVSLDTAHRTLQGLKELQYLVPLRKESYQLQRKKELLDKWIADYETRLKPALHLGNFTFSNEKDFLKWRNIRFDSTLTKWGGEPAGDLLTDYLKPETLTIYTDESKIDLIKNLKLIPNSKGYISIYKRFWKVDELKIKTVPPLLVYADLVNTGNRRNIETAQKVYEQYLQDKF